MRRDAITSALALGLSTGVLCGGIIGLIALTLNSNVFAGSIAIFGFMAAGATVVATVALLRQSINVPT